MEQPNHDGGSGNGKTSQISQFIAGSPKQGCLPWLGRFTLAAIVYLTTLGIGVSVVEARRPDIPETAFGGGIMLLVLPGIIVHAPVLAILAGVSSFQSWWRLCLAAALAGAVVILIWYWLFF